MYSLMVIRSFLYFKVPHVRYVLSCEPHETVYLAHILSLFKHYFDYKM